MAPVFGLVCRNVVENTYFFQLWNPNRGEVLAYRTPQTYICSKTIRLFVSVEDFTHIIYSARAQDQILFNLSLKAMTQESVK